MKKRSRITRDILFADGEPAKASLVELFRISDIIAKEYGIGSCGSFTQFVEMLNEEDPLIINGLLEAIKERKMIESGKNKNYVIHNNEEVGFESKERLNRAKAVFGFERAQLVEFLYNFGAPKEQIKDALEKIKSGKMKLPEHDHSWITSEELSKSDFPWEKVKKEMEENMKRSVNIDVSMATLTGRK